MREILMMIMIAHRGSEPGGLIDGIWIMRE
jgi:hypothetical protein